MAGKIIEESLAINSVGMDGYIRVVSNDGFSYRMPVRTFVELCASGETIQDAVDTWLTEHPEAVTTVQDGSITEIKLSADLRETLHTLITAVGGPNAAATVAEMTDHSKVYVYTGSESGYTFGNWYYYSNGVWVSGGVYNAAAIVTDTTLSVSGMAADAKATGDQITELKEDLTEIDGAVFGRETKTLVDMNWTGASSGTGNPSLGATIPKDTQCKIEITVDQAQANASTIYWRNAGGNLNYVGTIPANAQTATFDSAPTADANTLRINKCIAGAGYTIKITTEEVTNLVELNADEIDALFLDFSNIGKTTPITDLMTFQVGDWQNVNTFRTSVSYRVGCRTPITFDKTVYICALNGFAMSGYLGGTWFSTVGVKTIPANTELKLFIRRVWENTSESADVDEFTNGIIVLNYNPMTDYDLYKGTFSGIEMFRSAGFIGDSYTATRLGYSWVDIVQNITGVVCSKYAKSGADSGAWLNASSYGLPALLADTPKDLYWMALGINDGDRVDANSAYLGSINDISGSYEDYPDTFYGNTGHIIEAIQAFTPKAKIVLYKPIFTSVLRTLSGQSATQNGIKLVRDAIGEIAEHYGLPVMDSLDDVLYRSPWYSVHMDSAVSNGTHPSIMLYPAIAKANLRLFANCVQNYDAYFMDLRYDT